MSGHETRQSRWPPPHSYAMAVAGRSVLRGELAEFEPQMRPENPLMPVFAAGGNAVVFCGTLAGDRKGARFFTADPGHAEERYRAIHEHLESTHVDAIAGFEWLDAVIEMGTNTRPCVLMDWIEGSTLDKAIADRIGQRDRMDALVDSWMSLGHDLDRAQVAHGDLQHGNVMIDQTESLRLVDLDGMWIPTLESSPSNEIGHPNYQHPDRAERVDGDVDWGPDLDAFSWLVIYVSLAALAAEPPLWRKYHTGTNLVFGRPAFTDVASSEVWNDVAWIGPAVQLLREFVEAPSASMSLVAALAAAEESMSEPGVAMPPGGPPEATSESQTSEPGRAWWHDDDPGQWGSGVGSTTTPIDDGSDDDRSVRAGDPSDLQPDWTRPDASWLDDDRYDDDDWLGAPPPSSGRLVNTGAERSLFTAKVLAYGFAAAGIVAGIVAAVVEPPLPGLVGLVCFGILALWFGILALRRRGDVLATSPIVWDSTHVSIGSTWRAPYGDLRVERTPPGDLRFSGQGAPVTVDWLSESQRGKLIEQLGRDGVRTGEGDR